MDRDELKEYLPHREPMLLVDEIEIDADRICHAKYLVKEDEFFCRGHFPGKGFVFKRAGPEQEEGFLPADDYVLDVERHGKSCFDAYIMPQAWDEVNEISLRAGVKLTPFDKYAVCCQLFHPDLFMYRCVMPHL